MTARTPYNNYEFDLTDDDERPLMVEKVNSEDNSLLTYQAQQKHKTYLRSFLFFPPLASKLDRTPAWGISIHAPINTDNMYKIHWYTCEAEGLPVESFICPKTHNVYKKTETGYMLINNDKYCHAYLEEI